MEKGILNRHILTACVPFLLAVLVLCAGAGAAAAADRYRVTGLGDLYGGAFGSWAYGLNESTEVTGASRGVISQAFIWNERDGMTGLGTLPGTQQSFGKALNDSGQVAGHTVNPERIFIWEEGTGLVELNSAVSGRVGDINGIGQVVGYYHSAEGSLAFIWDASGGMRDMGTLSGGPSGSWANAINDFGQVTGGSVYSSIPDPLDPGMTIHLQEAFIWQEGGAMTGLGFLSGHIESGGNDINSNGVVAGYSRADNGTRQAVIWDAAGAVASLGAPPAGGIWSFANAINNAGQVVGEVKAVGMSGQASFVWDEVEGMRLLEDMLDASGAGWRLTAAQDINDRGEIVGYGTNPVGGYEAFLLTPVPCDAREKGKACRDGIDNDCDGAADADDSDCSGDDGGAEGKGKTCSDGVDNDLDGLLDCADPDCGKNRDCR